MSEPVLVALPATPYRGILPFLYEDHPIFFAREREARDLARLTVVYRGVFLYGESGAGKSSLINAGLIPAAEAEGFRADRIRVQARRGEELIVERIRRSSDSDSDFLPSSFAEHDERSTRIVVPVVALRERLAALDADAPTPLLIFDQFEELITLFEEASDADALREARSLQSAVVEALVDLLRDQTLPVKLLFVFREDYLAKVKKLLAACPELMHQSLRLAPPSTEALYKIIRGPFEEYPGQFERELSPQLAKRLVTAIEARSGTDEISLSELEVVCLRLWSAGDPEALFDEQGVEGLIEGYLWSSLDEFPTELRFPAIAVLSQMVTRSGTRNVISAYDLVERVRDEEDIPETLLNAALERLVEKTGLVRRESRRDLYLYEITSEFLVPWIRARQEEFVLAREREKLAAAEALRVRERRNRLFRILAATLLVLVAILATTAAFAGWQWRRAVHLEHQVQSQQFADRSARTLGVDPLRALLLGALAIDQSQTPEATAAFEQALAMSHVHALLRANGLPVRAAVFSPDGTLVATGGDGGTARIWDAASGRLLAELPAAKRTIDSIAFSRDGAMIVTAYDDGGARVWNVASRKMLADLHPRRRFHPDPLQFVPDKRAAFTANARRVLTVARDGAARVWDLPTGRERLELRGDRNTIVDSAAFNSDGSRVVFGSDDKTAQVWDVRTRRRLAVSHDHAGADLRVAFGPAAGQVMMTGIDGSIREWDMSTGRSSMVLKPHRNAKSDNSDEVSKTAVGTALSPDLRYVVAVRPDGVPRLWDLAARTFVRLRARTALISATFSADSRLLVTIWRDRRAQVWDVRTGRSVAVLASQKGIPYSATISPDDRRVLTTSAAGDAIIWTIRSGSQIGRVGTGPGRLTAARFTADGKSTIGMGRGVAYVQRSGQRGEAPLALSGEPAPVYEVAFSSDGRYIATAEGGNPTRVWPAEGGSPVELAVPTSVGLVYRLSFSADSRSLVVVGDERAVVFRVGSWAPVANVPISSSSRSVALSPDGRELATGIGRDIRIVDVRTGRTSRLIRFQGFGVRSISFSPDGRDLVVVPSFDGRPGIWSVAAGKHVDLPRGTVDAAFSPDGATIAAVGQFDGVRLLRVTRSGSPAVIGQTGGQFLRLSFSPTGRLLATASEDGTVRIWDVARRRAVQVIRPEHLVYDIAFSSDGRRLAIAGLPGPVQILSVATGETVGDLDTPPGTIDRASVARGGRSAFTLSEGVAHLWNATNGQSIAVVRGAGDRALLAASFSPDGRRLVGEADDGSVQSWDAATGEPLGELMKRSSSHDFGGSAGLAYGPGGRRMVAYLNGTARVLARGRSKAVPLRSHTTSIEYAAFSRDGRRIVTVGDDNAARIWDAEGGRLLAGLGGLGHAVAVAPAEFSPDATRLVTASADHVAIVWNTSGDQFQILRGHAGTVRDAVFSPDPDVNLVLTTSDDGTARVWDVGTGATCAVLVGGPAPIRAARFVTADRIMTVDADGIERAENVGLCDSALQHDLSGLAHTFLRSLNEADRNALAKPT